MRPQRLPGALYTKQTIGLWQGSGRAEPVGDIYLRPAVFVAVCGDLLHQQLHELPAVQVRLGEGGNDTVNSQDGVSGNDTLDGGLGTDTKVTDATEKSIV